MYNIVKNVITQSTFELKDIFKKINTLWAQGSLSDDERSELISLAQEKANMNDSIDIIAKLEELDKRVLALEGKSEDAEGSEEGDEPAGETYDPYTVGKWYYKDDIVEFEGTNYICIAPEGQVCTWSPVEYPAYWSIYS